MLTGVTGPRGATGVTGAKGEQGVTGSRGATGVTGPRGAAGVTGAKGDQGVTGPRGAAGVTGAKGDQGVTGPRGAAGVTGAKGDQGVTGPRGAAGVTGAKGDQGVTGPRGAAGVTGAKGDQGVTGPRGAAGVTGAKGDQGVTGPRGAAGVTGAKGDQGVTGPRGAAGVTGAKGDQGVTGPRGAAGVTGPKGATGATGPSGKSCGGMGELAFTPFDMTTQDDHSAPFFKVYDTHPAIALRGWPMKPSFEGQNPISLYFEVPKDFDHQGKTELDLHIVVPRTGDDHNDLEHVRNKKLKIRIRSDFKGNAQNLGCWFEDCVTECIKIEEPLPGLDCKKLRHYRVTVPLNSNHIDPQDLAILVIDRDNCDGKKPHSRGKEYCKDVYLVGASFRYARKCESK